MDDVLNRFTWLDRWRTRVFRTAASDGTGVALAHSRIYILPTRRGLAFIGTLAIMLVTSMNYALALGFVATFVLAGLLAAALLNTFRNLAGLAVRPAGAGETFAGGRLPFTLTLSGGTRARTSIAITARDATTRVVDVAADTITPVAFEIETASRGRVPLGRVTIASDFPLGLWRGWAYAHFPTTGIAYASPELGAPPLPPGQAGADATSQGRAEEAELAGLRDIPARRSAATRRVEGRRPGHRLVHEVLRQRRRWGPVALDFNALPGSLTVEQKLSRLTAWVLACEHAARPYSLILPSVRIVAAQGRDQRRAVLTAIALQGLQ